MPCITEGSHSTEFTSWSTDFQVTLCSVVNRTPPPTHTHDEAHHKRVRQQVASPLRTTNDEEFTRHEVQAALDKFDPRKAPGEDALSSEILLHVFRSFPTVFMEIYNECLRRGHFP